MDIVYGYSIGGVCAIYLANKYKEIKLLVADRTFSRIDYVGEGLLDRFRVTEFKWKILKGLSRTITKVLFYSDCIKLYEGFLEAECKKILIWDRRDEIIKDQSSLKEAILLQCFHLLDPNFCQSL